MITTMRNRGTGSAAKSERIINGSYNYNNYSYSHPNVTNLMFVLTGIVPVLLS